jgi:hypothetical protein
MAEDAISQDALQLGAIPHLALHQILFEVVGLESCLRDNLLSRKSLQQIELLLNPVGMMVK